MEGLYHIDMNRTASSKMKAYFIYVVDEDVYLNVYSDWGKNDICISYFWPNSPGT